LESFICRDPDRAGGSNYHARRPTLKAFRPSQADGNLRKASLSVLSARLCKAIDPLPPVGAAELNEIHSHPDNRRGRAGPLE